MAGAPGRTGRIVIGLFTVVAVVAILILTGAWEPLPRLAQWWRDFTAIATPTPDWQARVGGRPSSAAILASRQIVVVSPGSVDAFSPHGDLLWDAPADWGLPAGDVVVVHRHVTSPDNDPSHGLGYEVLDPQSGRALWRNGDAIAAWAFADAIVDLACPSEGECRLRAWDHQRADAQAPRWSVSLPGSASGLTGAAPQLANLADPALASTGSPPPLPPILGIPIDNGVQIVDARAGQPLRRASAPDPQTRITVAGQRLLFTHAQTTDSGCHRWVEARDARSDALAWQVDGLSLGTIDGSGCEQRRPAQGAGEALFAVAGDGRAALVSAKDGQTTWSGAVGERILAADVHSLLAQGGAKTPVRLIDLTDKQPRVAATVVAGPGAQAQLAPDFIAIYDPNYDRVLALGRTGTAILADLRIEAQGRVLAVGPAGILVTYNRTIGFVAVSAAV